MHKTTKKRSQSRSKTFLHVPKYKTFNRKITFQKTAIIEHFQWYTRPWKIDKRPRQSRPGQPLTMHGHTSNQGKLHRPKKGRTSPKDRLQSRTNHPHPTWYRWISPMNDMLIIANACTNANHVHLFSCPYQFPLDCKDGIATTFILVERWRTRAFSQWGYTLPLPCKKRAYTSL